MLKGRTPLGWLQLVHNKTRFIVACAGVGFAVVLVFMQLGFMNMLFDTTVLLHKKFQADVVLLSVEAEGMNETGSFSRRRLVQALGVPGVADAESVYIGSLNWTKPSGSQTGQILMLAVQPDYPSFNDPEVRRQLPSLHLAGSFLFDRGARGDYNAFLGKFDAGDRPQAEINQVKVSAIGTFAFGSSFATEAIAITSAETFLTLDKSRDPGVINMGLIQIAPGYEPVDVAERITRALGDEVQAMTMPRFIELSRNRLAVDSPIATVFSFGAIVGLAVGAIIVVQILSSDVQDHLGEYATFKAMGFTNSYLLGVVYEQSAILTVFGFIPAYLLSLLLYVVVGGLVDMDMTMTVARTFQVFGLNVLMCAVSGTIAMRRVYRADPADVF
jgi:putative ABC transport system permease protein